jgi:nucleotide-binding universal stress UspA family protein
MTSAAQAKFPIAKILVCVAEGAASDHAVRAAALLATSSGARVDLLHVVEPILAPSRRYMTVSGPDISHTHAENVGARLREHMTREFARVRVNGKPVEQALEIAVGAPSRVVLERSANYDIVFVGESGRRKQLDFGGLARSLFAHCTTPLWIQVDAPRKVGRILAPVDLSPKSLEVLQRAVAFAQLLGAKVTALHCFVAPEIFAGPEGAAAIPSPTYTIDSLREAEQSDFTKMMEEFDWRGVAHEAVFAADDPARRILAVQDSYDLIVLGSHGQSALLASVLGSVSWRVLRMAHTGMMLVRTSGGFALG